ncbi:hypothetical protein SRB5_50020 [Streptomyces sp. RB5]|uniref:Uncharacterized protein n=1 Tax=Streptomyces smaragdinus TaxID=2585196 RepID=A0A7K0CMW8_9ACTN|nr:hypothetical protein [Streptomyces smaragdinus]MQY14826.1 hypothetical protein [Streptomyces smaragdinus]
MPLAIAVTSPDLVLPETPVLVLQSPREQSLEDALARTSAILEHHGFLLVVYPQAAPAAVVRRLHTVRSVLESDRIALVPLPLPPLAVAVLARQLTQLTDPAYGPQPGPGIAASAARLLTHYVYAGGLLGSLSKLDRVPVALGRHLKSRLPGAQHAVLAAPREEAAKADRPPAGPDFATTLVVARGQLAGDWPERVLAPAWRVRAVLEVPLPGPSAAWWATSRVVEFAAGIFDPGVLHQLVASVRRERCPWCGLEVLGDRCVLCVAPVPPGIPAPSPPTPMRLLP